MPATPAGRRGRPRKPGTKLLVRLDPAVRDDLDKAVTDGRARSLSGEVNRRCRAVTDAPTLIIVTLTGPHAADLATVRDQIPDMTLTLPALNGEQTLLITEQGWATLIATQWRHLVPTVRIRPDPDGTVLVVNGHAYPATAHRVIDDPGRTLA